MPRRTPTNNNGYRAFNPNAAILPSDWRRELTEHRLCFLDVERIVDAIECTVIVSCAPSPSEANIRVRDLRVSAGFPLTGSATWTRDRDGERFRLTLSRNRKRFLLQTARKLVRDSGATR